ncbi:MAG: putative porin [Thermodesulfobacteriota bacterium]
MSFAKRLIPLAMAASLAAGPAAAAGPPPADADLAALVRLLGAKGVLTPGEEEAFLDRLTGQAADRPTVTILPEGDRTLGIISDNVARDLKAEVKEELKAEIKSEVASEVRQEGWAASTPGWSKRIRWGGDVRLRYQGSFFDEGNDRAFTDPESATAFINTTDDRHRARVRVRLGATARVHETVEAGVKIATGNEREPISTNETLGDAFNKDSLVLDQAYLKWSPIPEVTLWGGRLPNPFVSSELVWDRDLNPEGLALQGELPVAGTWRLFANAGLFPLEEVERAQRDKWLAAGQMGARWQPSPVLLAELATSLYDYRHTAGEMNPLASPGLYDWTAPRFRQGGNTVFNINAFTGGTPRFALASEFREVNVSGSLDIGVFAPVHVILTADWVRNLGYDAQDVLDLAGYAPDKADTGYLLGLSVGHASLVNLGDWRVGLQYRYLEANAVLDAFTDSDFHPLGTNARGWLLSGELGLTSSLSVAGRFITSDLIEGRNAASDELSVDTVQVDLNAKF